MLLDNKLGRFLTLSFLIIVMLYIGSALFYKGITEGWQCVRWFFLGEVTNGRVMIAEQVNDCHGRAGCTSSWHHVVSLNGLQSRLVLPFRLEPGKTVSVLLDPQFPDRLSMPERCSWWGLFKTMLESLFWVGLGFFIGLIMPWYLVRPHRG